MRSRHIRRHHQIPGAATTTAARLIRHQRRHHQREQAAAQEAVVLAPALARVLVLALARRDQSGRFFRVNRIARSPPMGIASPMALAAMATSRLARYERKCQ